MEQAILLGQSFAFQLFHVRDECHCTFHWHRGMEGVTPDVPIGRNFQMDALQMHAGRTKLKPII